MEDLRAVHDDLAGLPGGQLLQAAGRSEAAAKYYIFLNFLPNITYFSIFCRILLHVLRKLVHVCH